MTKNLNGIIGIFVIILGAVIISDHAGLEIVSTGKILPYMLIALGFLLVIFNIDRGQRGLLFVGSVLFIIGITLFVTNEFEILSPVKTLLPTIFFALGTGFLLLFINNSKVFIFLIIGMICILFGTLTVIFYDETIIIKTANRIAFIIFEFWPLLVLFMGIGILLNVRKTRS